MTIEAKLRDGGLSKSDFSNFQRRLFLKRGLSLSALTLLTGCDITNTGPVDGFLRMISRMNDGVQTALFRPNKLARSFPESMVPREFRYNAQYGPDRFPIIDPTTWRLELAGAIASKQPWTLKQLQALPQTSYVPRHLCLQPCTTLAPSAALPL